LKEKETKRTFFYSILLLFLEEKKQKNLPVGIPKGHFPLVGFGAAPQKTKASFFFLKRKRNKKNVFV
jgi:hypothetical protein